MMMNILTKSLTKPLMGSLPQQQQRVAHMGILSSIKDSISSKVKKTVDNVKDSQQDKQFVTQRDEMLQIKEFTLHEFQTFLDKMVNQGWKSKIPGTSKIPEMAETRKYVTILQSIDDAQKTNPSTLTGKTKVLAVRKSGESPELMNQMLMRYEVFRFFHASLHARARQNLPLPTTNAEHQDMMAEDPNSPESLEFRKRLMKKQKLKAQRKRR